MVVQHKYTPLGPESVELTHVTTGKWKPLKKNKLVLSIVFSSKLLGLGKNSQVLQNLADGCKRNTRT